MTGYAVDGTAVGRLLQGAAGETPPEDSIEPKATDISQGREATPEGELKNEAPTRAYSTSRPVSSATRSEGGTVISQAFFTDRCHVMVEVKRDTYVGCGLKLGHDGPHEPPKPPKQVAT